jgi:Calcineurin-like phosphoesterase
MPPVFVVGDVHGHRDVLVGLMRSAGLLDEGDRWVGGDAVVWLLGDLVDRGPDGLGAIDLVRRLEQESAGTVRCLLGNHEASLLSAHFFGNEEVGPGTTFADVWRVNGGLATDLTGLTAEHVEWIVERPAVALEGAWLLLHADTDGYLAYGQSLEAINAGVSTALRSGAAAALAELLDVLSERLRLDDPPAVDRLLRTLGGQRIVHGHTPIASVLGLDPRAVTAPLRYGDGRVLNVDHCLFAGGPGFVTRLEAEVVIPERTA